MAYIKSIGAFVKKYKWALILAFIALFCFYWYEMRPIMIFRGCAAQSSADARTLLRSKAEISKGTDQGNAYAKLIEKNLYLRSDYESFLTKCLTHHGLQIVPLDESAIPQEAVQ
jgi:hypothetical protein